jgi:hypothetical protein
MVDNSYQGWTQGHFIDGPIYSNWSLLEKLDAENHERFLVRPSPKENAICECRSPEIAKWIAERLNLAARLEQLIKKN